MLPDPQDVRPLHALGPCLRANHGTWRGWVRHGLGLAELQLGRLQPFLQADVRAAQRLVFVCLGNINRSAFAGGVAQSLGLPTHSIGLNTGTGQPATRQAVAQAARQGFDLSGHRATAFPDYQSAPGDLLFVMEVRHAHELVRRGVPPSSITFLGLWARPARVHLHDPHTLSDDYFATCFTLIESAVRRLHQARQGAPR